MFITFEGPEGSGKTTQIQALHTFLVDQGYDVVVAREPGGTSIGDQIRHVLLDVHNREMVAEAEVLLFSASRAQLVRQVIKPALARGAVVICDRFADSTLAYQGYGRKLDLALLESITRFATGSLRTDLTVYLDVDVEVGLRRKREHQGPARRQGSEGWNRLDQETVSYHLRVREGYLELARHEPHRWLVVDADRAPDVIQHEIRQRLASLLANRVDQT
jgi:dTMP kinase